MSSAEASHILVKTKESAEALIAEIENGGDFGELAQKNSECPSGRDGGKLGSFSPGRMVKEFDQVIFDEANEIGKVHGPVETQFGYHLIMITKRDS
jgi:peptidyl-prolyl cis-trans isomerase C